MHATLLLEIGVAILGLGLLGSIAARGGFSPVPLYLLAGLAFGHGGLFPLDTTEEFVSVGADIGIVLLLLTLGLEYTANELVTNLRKNARPGLVDIVVNATPGAVAALLLGWGPVEIVALAGVTYVTSSGITAKLLEDFGWIGNRETPIVLSLLVIEDLTMALYLPLVTALLAGATLAGAGLALLIALGTVSFVLYVALRHGRFVTWAVSGPNDEILLLKVLGLTIAVAGIAEYLGVSAAVGAFLVGIALSGPLVDIARGLLSPLRDLFAAFFFLFFGLRTDPADLIPLLPVAAALAIAGVLTKFGTGYWAAQRAGRGVRGRYRAGLALIPRGEFSIVIAGLAAAGGAESRLAPLAAAYVLLVALIVPVLARIAEPRLRRPPTPPSIGGITPVSS